MNKNQLFEKKQKIFLKMKEKSHQYYLTQNYSFGFDFNAAINKNSIDFKGDNIKLWINSLIIMFNSMKESLVDTTSLDDLLDDYSKKANMYKYINSVRIPYYFRYFLYQYYSIVNHIVFIISKIRKYDIRDDEISYSKIKNIISKDSRNDIIKIWNKIGELNGREYIEMNNIQKHRYLLGINHLSRFCDVDNESIPADDMLRKSMSGEKEEDIEEKRSTKLVLVTKPDIIFSDVKDKYHEDLDSIYEIIMMIIELPEIIEIVEQR